MIKLKIMQIHEYQYVLKCENDTYALTIEFYDLEKQPSVNDYIILNEKILADNSSIYSFGALDSKYGKDISNMDDDIIALLIDDKEIYLKRLYG